MLAVPERLSSSRCFGGTVAFYRHHSIACSSPMQFSVYLPPQVEGDRVPVLYFLSGLTCTEENFMVKAGAQRYAAELRIAIVVPDTSPRDTGIAGEDDDWDLGSGAGFYLDATEEPWCNHYRMYSYVTEELPQLIAEHFPIQPERQSIFGHSMGGHGALICALKNPDRYRSISALAPIAAPMQCPWGQKAFSAYLGGDRERWLAYDASELVKTSNWSQSILIDQGSADPFLEQNQLLPDVFERACKTANVPLELRYRQGYEHGYYFIASFIEDHIKHHGSALYA
ncbi:S-formylglutathione hydrolase [Synechococcus sp. PCC 7336]|uniref:S-formylglutathione hydrolase n=1 Tax=Synechococcus sp. PCC 7336 TaxID=195250 RepID=UPI00034DAB93|nr:S-formylglutathione hydrolase [Synechococcus sp. PCC 7336]